MGRNLPLTRRRRNAAGLSARIQRAWGSRRFISLGSGRRAQLTSAQAGTNNKITFTAVTPGVAGNSLQVSVAAGGAAPVVTFPSATQILITTPLTATADQVIDAVNRAATTDAAGRAIELLWAQRAAANDGTGQVGAAFGYTNLAGGTAAG